MKQFLSLFILLINVQICVSQNARIKYHDVEEGETIDYISTLYNTPGDSILAWNRISTIEPYTSLTIYLPLGMTDYDIKANKLAFELSENFAKREALQNLKQERLIDYESKKETASVQEKLELAKELKFFNDSVDLALNIMLSEQGTIISELNRLEDLSKNAHEEEVVSFQEKEEVTPTTNTSESIKIDVSTATRKNRTRSKEEKNKQKENQVAKADTTKKNKQWVIDINQIDVEEDKNKRPKFGDDISKTDKQKAKFLLKQAYDAIDSSDFKTANKFVDKSLKLFPSYDEALIIKGDLYAVNHDFKKALTVYEKADMVKPNSARLKYNIGICYDRLKETDMSIAYYTNAIELKENYMFAYTACATAYMDKEMFEQAIEDFTYVIENNDQFYIALRGRGISYYKTGEYDEARKDLNTYLNIEEKDVEALYYRGMSHLYLDERYDGCVDLLNASQLGYKEAKSDLKKYCK